MSNSEKVKGLVLVKHIVTYDKRGNSKITLGRPIVQKIEHFYMDGTIGTTTGDVWDVVKTNDKRAEYETVMAIDV